MQIAVNNLNYKIVYNSPDMCRTAALNTSKERSSRAEVPLLSLEPPEGAEGPSIKVVISDVLVDRFSRAKWGSHRWGVPNPILSGSSPNSRKICTIFYLPYYHTVSTRNTDFAISRELLDRTTRGFLCSTHRSETNFLAPVA